MNKARENRNEHNDHIETLAFLSGYKENDVITISNIIFPNQEGSFVHVDDHGK